jgi:hypothetical protein
MLLTLMLSYCLQFLTDRVASWIGPEENEISTYKNVKQVVKLSFSPLTNLKPLSDWSDWTNINLRG